MKHFLLVIAAWLMIPALCPAQPPAHTPEPTARPDDGNPPDELKEAITPPDSAVGRQLAWVMKVVNDRALPADFASRFSKRFLEVYSQDDVKKTLTSLRDESFGGKQVNLVQVCEEQENEYAMTGIVRGGNDRRFLSVFIALDEASGKIAGLMFNPAGYICLAGDWDDMNGELGAIKGASAFGAYEIVTAGEDAKDKGFTLRPVYEYGWDERLGVAATFHLFVAGAVAEGVAQGTSAWAAPVPVRDKLKCIPGGQTSSLAPGTEVSLGDMVFRMLHDSDTTAADHLIARVGRDKLGDFFAARVAKPQRSLPILYTRELFALKLSGDEALLADYANADAQTRGEMLAPGGDVAALSPDWSKLQDWDKPVAVDAVEYFLTPREMCSMMAELHLLSRKAGMEPLAKALAAPSPVKLDANLWSDVVYKGGTEPGVESDVWVLHRSDGRWYAMGVTWNNIEKPLESERLYELARAGFKLLSRDKAQDTPKPEPGLSEPSGQVAPTHTGGTK